MPRASDTAKPHLVTRRRRAESRTVKKSFTLREDTVSALSSAVRSGDAENASAFVEAAIDEKLRRGARAALFDSYADAARDPAFMADMRAVAKHFKRAVADGLRDD